jgi:diadenosine tetraphosphatase ApaH/serine/threonine PP2A family protein phosphatase
MRILVITDVHANITALEAVLADAGEFDATWCLGDLVGYGPDPNEVIESIRQLPNLSCLMGNHDAASLNKIETSAFNTEARQALKWTQKFLSDASLNFLKSLPEKLNIGDVTLAHGSPRYPIWEYLLDTRNATSNFDFFETAFCFVGHTHLPVIYVLDGSIDAAQLDIPVANTRINLKWRSIVNPGSVGQPRDRDTRAAFALYTPDDNTWDYRRVAYDIPAVQARMVKAGLPERHIIRLASGW